jgi:DNA-directed RNA polymerase
LDTQKGASTPVELLHRQRQKREEARAIERTGACHRQLIAQGRESATSYGAALFRLYGETVNVALDAMLTRLLENPHMGGKHLGAWPLLLHFCDRGPRSIAAIALGVVIDGISRRPRRSDLAKSIGRALQDEHKATRLYQQKGVVLLNTLKRKFGRKAIDHRILNELYVGPSGWTQKERRELGQLLLEVIATNTTLIRFTNDRVPLVEPTEDALEVVGLNPPRPLPVRMIPSLLPPEPWTDVVRGTKALVTSRKPMDLSHITAKSVKTALEVVNTVEQQQIQIDPWMVEQQRQAWDANLPDLFPVQRDPFKASDAHAGAAMRQRIEESIRQAEEVGAYPIWLEHDFDFRGRLYCCSRIAGHQGPDHQKALISFAQEEPVDDDAFRQMLMAAAGHYGLSRASWEEREAWGRDNLQLIQAVAAAPLDQLDLWKSAKDPWQFLQLARAIALYLEGVKASGVPIRFDQTCSGLGIISALVRDRHLARLTNLIGDTRADVYAHVADRLLELLRADLDSLDLRDRHQAELWLKHSIDRSLVKGPVMTTIYGAQRYGLVEQLVAYLQEKNPDVRVSYWQREYTKPAQYLARKLQLVIGAELGSCIAMEAWLRDVSRRCMKQQQPIRWLSPMGFPVSLGRHVEETQKISTAINGSRRWRRFDAVYEEAELSARATSRGITANAIHTFDAAFCHALVLRCASIETPVLTNHDCFATLPARADWLHHTLHGELRALYATDWLAEIRVEVGRNAGIALGQTPFVGDLCEGDIGQNPYCFS